MNHRLRLSIGLTVAMLAPAVLTLAAPAATVSAVTCTVTTVLRPNNVNSGVNCLEQRLIELGYEGIGTPDSTYGTNSAHAVKHFQTQRGLYPDGIVTSVTGRQLGLRGALPPATVARATVIGDSTSAAMRWYDEANNNTLRYDVMGGSYDLLWSIESCRRLVAASCVGRTDPGTGLKWRPVSTLPLMQTTLRGFLGEALVIMAGYDDYTISNAIDPIMAEAKAQGVARVFWLNYRTSNSYSYGAYYAAHNVQLEAAKVRHPNLVVLDWNGYTRSQTSATQSAWFESDQIHMKAAGAAALANWLKGNLDNYKLQRCTAVNAQTGTPSVTDGVSTAETDPAGFLGLTPVRVLDTRSPGTGGANGRVGGGRRVLLDLSAVIPSDAEAVALSITAVDPCKSGFLTVYDCDVRPSTSNLNFVAARNTAGLAISPLGAGRTVCVYTSAPTDLIVDVTGVFSPSGAGFTPLPPTRWIDTRGNAATVNVEFGIRNPGSDTEVPLAGVGAIPADATAVWLNVTGTNATGNTYFTVYPGPCGTPSLTSNVNILRNRNAASAVLVGIGTSGSVCVRVGGASAYLVVDVAGYFSPSPAGLDYQAGPLTRLFDTRPGAAPAAGTVHQIGISNVSVLSVASVGASANGFVSLKPCGVNDTSSLINNSWNETTANATAIAPGENWAVCASASMNTDIIVDRLGTFLAPT